MKENEDSILSFFGKVLRQNRTPDQKALTLYESAFRSGHRDKLWTALTLLEMECNEETISEIDIDSVLEALMYLV